MHLSIELLENNDDANMFAYLEDIHPEGFVTYVTESVLRISHQCSDTHPCIFSAKKHYIPTNSSTSNNTQLTSECFCSRSYHKKDFKKFTGKRIVKMMFEPVSYNFKYDHRIRISLAGVDKDNF